MPRVPQNQKVRLGVRGRLLLVILPLVNLAFLGIWLISTITARDGLTRLSRQNLALGSRNLSDALGKTLDDAYSDAVTTARLDLAAQAIDSGDPKNIEWYADEIVRTKRKYAAILVADARGVIVGANTLDRHGKKLAAGLAGGSLGDLAWAREALAAPAGTATFVPPSRPAAVARALGPEEQVVGFSLPILDVMDERIGTVSLLVSLDFLGELLDGYTELGDDGIESAAIIANREGQPLVLPSRLGRAPPWRAARLPAAAAASSWQGPDARSYLASGSAVGGAVGKASWTLVTVKTVAALEGPIDAMSRRLLLAFVLAVVIATVALVLYASRLVAPLRRLTRAASSAARAGDYQALPIETHDEIGALTASFNQSFETIQSYERDLERKVDERTRELREAKQEVSDILDNIAQGIVTVDTDGRVNKEYSAFSRRIFGEITAIAGRPLLELLGISAEQGGDTFARMDFWLKNVTGADELQWELAESEPVRELGYARPDPGGGPPESRRLELDYVPIIKDGVVAKIMVLAKDVTELSLLHAEVERKEAENRRNLQRIAEIVSLDRDLFETFIGESAALLARSGDALESLGAQPDAAALHALFRAVHTLKGNARIFKITSVQDAAHELEEWLARVRDARQGLSPPEVAAIGERIARLRGLIAEFEALGRQVLGFESTAVGDERARTMLRIPEARVVDVRRAFKELARSLSAAPAGASPIAAPRHELATAIQKLTMVPLVDLFSRLAKMTFDLALELGKRVEDLHVEGGDVEVDTVVVTRMQEVLVHALRNAVDHGIEPPLDRVAAGKPERGRISVRCSHDGEGLAVDVSDDGAGVDFDALRQRAIGERFIAEDRIDSVSEDELAALLFRPGFSLARRVSKVSGRGVGMDVILSTLRELGGSAEISTSKGRGMTLKLRIPTAAYQTL